MTPNGHLSGSQLIAALERLGFERASETGSHTRMRKGRVVVTAPDLGLIEPDTLRHVLRQAGESPQSLDAALRGARRKSTKKKTAAS
ncbi:MAG: addiction module toxin, HicA family [Acidobacteria bacterium]|nr:addiction module toxin, HicA family [Acidobacteriota bacterium]